MTRDERDVALLNSLVANERMGEFAKRLDAQFEAAQAAVKTEMERTDV